MGDEGKGVVGRIRRSVRRHTELTTAIVVITIGFSAYGVAIGSPVAVPYGVLVLGGLAFVLAIEPEVGYSTVALAGLSLWAFGHLAGGIVPFGADGHPGVLYGAGLVGPTHWDNPVHFIGFGTAGLVWWEVVRSHVRVEAGRTFAIGVAVWFVAMGVGALNEVLEFILTLVLPETNIGGYHNTGKDLIANMLGAATAAVIVVHRERRATGVARLDP